MHSRASSAAARYISSPATRAGASRNSAKAKESPSGRNRLTAPPANRKEAGARPAATAMVHGTGSRWKKQRNRNQRIAPRPRGGALWFG
jgi:hypothetical protein